ncbi:MAG: lidL [Verrucomicrobiales bacterium]|nr:lidL [Verrucomicrobiales bacterium]
MKPRPRFLSLAAALSLGSCAVPSAWAKFLSPPDVLKEPALTAVVDLLKTAKTPEESKPAFESALKLATEASSPERQFLLGYLYQYGIGTEAAAAKSREAYQKAADAGFAPAKNNLGLLNLATGVDPAKSVALIEDLANTGNAAAQTSMGQLYLDGIPAAGIAKDPEKARVWFERASAGGDSDASWTLAMLLANQPKISEADAQKAIELMEQAVKANHLPALVEYGTRLASGAGLKPDIERGLSLLQKAIDQGSTQAIMALGSLYENGTGVKKDEKKAFEYYTQAIARNEYSAYNKLGYFYENGIGVTQDTKKAVENYQAGAGKKVGMCMYNLAVFHDAGKGGLKKDPAAAFDWHYKAAMSAFVPSQLALGTRYRDGKGTAADPQAALAWFQRAMQNGDVTGALNVASLLESGSTGVVDNKTAAAIYKDAAGKGNPMAMASLGAMIEDGRGVQGDFKQVFLLYTAGAEAKIEAAKERLANFKKRLTPDQLKEAEAFVLANRTPGAPGTATPEKTAEPAESKDKPKTKEPAKPAKGSKDKR